MIKLKKPASVILAASLMLSLCSCNSEPTQQQSSGDYHFKWMDSAIFDNVEKMKDVSIKDDFAAAVNYEWASQQKEDFTYPISSIGEANRNVVRNKRAMLDDKSFQNKNVELIRIMDGLYNDVAYRDSLGVEPLKKYLGYIDDIKTIDDVTAYMTDNSKNPFATALVKLDYSENETLDGEVALYLSKPDLTLEKTGYYVSIENEGLKMKDTKEKRIKYLLERCGYDAKEIDKLIKASYRFEYNLVNLDYTDVIDYTSVKTRTEVLDMAGNYPFKDMLDNYKITKCDRFMGDFKYLDKLESIYNQKNVEDIKAFFKVRLTLDSMLYLDTGAFNCYQDTGVDRTDKFDERIDREQDFYFFYLIGQTALTAALDQAYIDYYYDEDIRNEVKDFIRQIKEKYLILIDSNEHLSDASKKAVREKLNKLGENVMLPSNKADFGGMELKTKEEGGSFLDAMCQIKKAELDHVGEMVQSKLGRSFWDIYDPDLSTTAVGASYFRMQNTIYIKMGILTDPIYSKDASLEKKLGSFVAVLGHEISHAFDVNNITMDADGKKTNIITSNEMAFVDEKKSMIWAQFSGYEPFPGCGAYTYSSDVSGEAIADAQGIKVALMIGKDHEGFDYDQFFRGYATFWRTLQTKSAQKDAVKNDEHALSYLRINYTMLQFDEFIETYGLKPGDGMYLDPSQRILIW